VTLKPAWWCALPVILLVLAAGCATRRQVHHFGPSPADRVRAQELGPAKPRSATELVQEARDAFNLANEAYEKGDRGAALREYVRMLDRLREANLDPIIYHNLRGEFERILDAGVKPSEEGAVNPAREALAQANAAQEQGDSEAALRQYNRMLDLLAKAVPGSDTLYGVRDSLRNVLATGEREAAKYDRRRVHPSVEELSKGIMAELGTPSVLSDRVLTEIAEIQNLYPRNFQGGLDRSYKYLPYIREEFARAGLPPDLVWLAMVESQFSPKVVSRAGAGGMWQFMRATGARYGLKCDRFVDERMNWRKATQGAIRYLSDLNERFDGSWPLAVTAYNMGEGGLDRVLAAANGERNLWKLLDMPSTSALMMDETKKFYAKLLASIIVAKDPERFGFTSNPQPAEDTVQINVRGAYSLDALEKAAGLPDGTLRALNPDLIRGITPPNTEFALHVPPAAHTQLASALQSVPAVGSDVLRSWDRKHIHVVKRGETIDIIARKYGVSASDLLKANRIQTASRLTAGRRLTIPAGEFDLLEDRSRDEIPGEPAAALSRENASGNKGRMGGSSDKVYTVQKGDTLSNIAAKHKVTLAEVLSWNKIKKPEAINIGDKLVLKGVQSAPEEPMEELHVVRAGESLAKIAKQYGVKIDDIAEWNKITTISKINIGDKLVIKGMNGKGHAAAAPVKSSGEQTGKMEEKKAAPAPQSQDGKKIVHTVAKGETASSIAARYKVKVSQFLAWNGLTTASVIRAGDQHVVYLPGGGESDPPETLAQASPAKPAADKKPENAPETPKRMTLAKNESAKPKEPSGTVHIVAKGETLSSIAARYKVKVSDICKWNGWTKSPVLQIGQKVSIQG